MTWLWVVLAVVAVTGAVVVFRSLAKVLAAARQLQRNVDVLNDQVSAELRRLADEVSELGDSVDEAPNK